jgi:hypothetical protein
LIVPVYRVDRVGVLRRELPTLRVVCRAVEQTVSKRVGTPAGGTTAKLSEYIYSVLKRDGPTQVTLYPRAMGYLIAHTLKTGKSASAALLRAYKNGRLTRLGRSKWHP